MDIGKEVNKMVLEYIFGLSQRVKENSLKIDMKEIG